VRLPEATRRFAWESLNAKYGRETETTPGVHLDDVPGFREMPPLDRYDIAIRRIAENAPLRICDGERLTNAVTDLVLDIVEELSISDFPISIRLNRDTPEPLLRHAAEVVRHCGGVVAFYGETSVIRSLVSYGYDEAEARQFANDGCWEIQVPGRRPRTSVHTRP
jgi:hypothetical protein